jgi:hypothetical protein
MLSTITTIVHAVWGYLPQITADLQFGAALIGFCLRADAAVQAMAQPDASSPVKSHGPRCYLALSRLPAGRDALTSLGMMTTAKALAVLKEICSLTGLNVSEALPLHQHVAKFFLFEADWSASSFPDSCLIAISCCGLPVQVLGVDLLRGPVSEC